MSLRERLTHHGAKLFETVLSSVVFAFVVGLLILNAEEAAAIRADALKLASRLDQTARAGFDRNITWSDDRRAVMFSEIDGLLYDLSDRLPDDILACFALLADDAKESRFATLSDPGLAIDSFRGRLGDSKQAVRAWYRHQVFGFGLFRGRMSDDCR